MNVSVVIPCLNERHTVPQAVSSAWAAGADEVIVVDGGSRDGTWQCLQRLPCRAVRGPRGRAVQQNLGARLAQGDVLLFLHADCRLRAGAADQARRVLARFEHVVAGAFRQRILAPGVAFRLLELGNAVRALWLQCPFGDQALFIRRRVFEHLGGFPLVPLMEDVLLSRAAARLGPLVLLSGPVLVSPRRWLRCGIVRQTLTNWRLLWGLWRKRPWEQLAAAYAPVR